MLLTYWPSLDYFWWYAGIFVSYERSSMLLNKLVGIDNGTTVDAESIFIRGIKLLPSDHLLEHDDSYFWIWVSVYGKNIKELKEFSLPVGCWKIFFFHKRGSRLVRFKRLYFRHRFCYSVQNTSIRYGLSSDSWWREYFNEKDRVRHSRLLSK